jgi:hypothetical protein
VVYSAESLSVTLLIIKLFYRTLQRGSTSAISGAAEDHGSNLIFETEYKAADNVQTSLGDWGNARMDQQVKTSPFWTIYSLLTDIFVSFYLMVSYF